MSRAVNILNLLQYLLVMGLIVIVFAVRWGGI